MRVAVVVNPKAGRGRAAAAAADLRGRFSRAGFAPSVLALDSPEAEWTLAASGARAIVAVGGDGTVRAVASRLATSPVPLAILPTGTENLAARAYGFRPDPQALVRAVAQGRSEPVDVGVIRRHGREDHRFLVMASAGFDASVVAALDAVRRGPISHASYLRPILRTARTWVAPQVTATPAGTPGPVLSASGQVVIANAAPYALGLDPARAADPRDGLLDLVLLPARGWIGVARWALRLRLGRAPLHGIGSGRAPCWRILFGRPVHLQADGDLVPGGPVAEAEFRVLPGALQVLAAAD